MNSNLSLSFSFNNNEIQVVGDPNSPLFVAAHVAQALGFDKPDNAYRMLDDDEKYPHIVRGSYGEKEMICVNESGLYNLIFKSRKPEAQAFRKWVTSEVLPSIRKTGGYALDVVTKSTSHADLAISLLQDKVKLIEHIMQLKEDNVELQRSVIRKKRNGNKLTDTDIEKAVSLFLDGFSCEAIAIQLGTSSRTVRRRLDERGVR